MNFLTLLLICSSFPHADKLHWRSIGPATMGGRIVDLEVDPNQPRIFYVATASGGLFKTENNGQTFFPLFDQQSTLSLGDVALAPSNPQIIWAGTGEPNARNSVSWGDGVYRSDDGGKTWKHRGLPDSFQIGRIAIHPRDPQTVYVGALGRLWGANQHRGVYKTNDGGETWEKSLYIDENTGCVDIAMHPNNPDILLAAMYQRRRGIYDTNDPEQRWGPGGGLYKTEDGGKTWRKLTNGLPKCQLGRIGIAYSRQNPHQVFAIVESEKIGAGAAPGFLGVSLASRSSVALRAITPGGPAAKAGLKAGDRLLEIAGVAVKTTTELQRELARHPEGKTIKVKAQRGQETIEVDLTLGRSPRASDRPWRTALGGQPANIQDRQGAEGVETGGVYHSIDGGENWKRINSLNPRPFYYSQIRIDPTDDRYQYVLGIALHQSKDSGKTFQNIASNVHLDHHALWINPDNNQHLILGNDGGVYVSYDRGKHWDFLNTLPLGQFYHVEADAQEPYWVYGGLQDNGSWMGPSQTPKPGHGPRNSDWRLIGYGDGFICRIDPQQPQWLYYEAQWGQMFRINRKTGEKRSLRPRNMSNFGWKAPYMLSHHQPRVFYAVNDHVLRSADRGEKLEAISPRIARTKQGCGSALSESPLSPQVLYAGTNDGAIWGSVDGGKKWTDLTEKVKSPGAFHVSSIEASRHAEGRAYLTLDGHRSDDDRPFVYITEDHGQSWRPLHKGLPNGSARVLREDPHNPNLLYLGTEFGAWASADRGKTWFRLKGLPSVAVHEFALPEGVSELVAATHGRSLWVLDIAPLRQWTTETAAAELHLFVPEKTILWKRSPVQPYQGDRRYYGDNPPRGAVIYYYLKEKAKKAEIEIRNDQNRRVRLLKGETNAGLHRVIWDLRRAGPGTHKVKLIVDGEERTQSLELSPEPTANTSPENP